MNRILTDEEVAMKAFSEWNGEGKPLAGYTAYKGADLKLFAEDEARKLNMIEMKNQTVV